MANHHHSVDFSTIYPYPNLKGVRNTTKASSFPIWYCAHVETALQPMQNLSTATTIHRQRQTCTFDQKCIMTLYSDKISDQQPYSGNTKFDASNRVSSLTGQACFEGNVVLHAISLLHHASAGLVLDCIQDTYLDHYTNVHTLLL
jgi:hypothetical protein